MQDDSNIEVLYDFFLTPEAEKELLDIQEIYDSYSEQAGDNFMAAFTAIRDLLIEFPYAAKLYDETTGIRKRTISKRYPFALYYTVHDKELDVIAVALQSDRQNPEKLQNMIIERIKRAS